MVAHIILYTSVGALQVGGCQYRSRDAEFVYSEFRLLWGLQKLTNDKDIAGAGQEPFLQ